MKEYVYGWYPPAREILSKSYPSPAKSDSYTKECLYRHPTSRYAGQKGVATPEAPYSYSPARPKSRSPTRHSSRRQYRVHSQQTPTINLEIRGTSQMSRQESPAASRPGSCKPNSGQAFYSKPWCLDIQATPIPSFEEFLSKQNEEQNESRPATAESLGNFKSSWKPASPAQRDVTSSFSERRDRIKSATTYRPRHSPPTRPVRSADPSRRTPVTMSSAPTLPSPPPPTLPTPPPLTPPQLADVTNLVQDLDLYVEQGPADVSVPLEPGQQVLGVDNPKDYDEEMTKYGWRMEVPGDPLNIKRPCLAKRMPITVVMEEREIGPNPYKTRAENWQTFFLNTIPRRHATYTIHPEFSSEVLHAKRMELQKRDGDLYKYRKTNYSFAY